MNDLSIIFIIVIVFSLIALIWVKMDPRFKDKAHKSH